MFLENKLNAKRMKIQYSQSMIHSVLNSLPTLDFNLVIQVNINLEVQKMLCVHAEVKLKLDFLLRCHLYSPQRLVLFKNLEKVDSSFLNLKVKDKLSFYYMVPNQQLPKAPILKFLNL